MNQNRNNQERDENYQNIGRGARGFQNRPNGVAQAHPNLNPNYQNPIDLVRNNHARGQQEPEENIYERLDNDDDDDDENNGEAARNEPIVRNNQDHHMDDHTYERIDDRRSCSRRAHSRGYKYHVFMPGPSFLSDTESKNLGQYDQPRNIYLDSSRLNNQFCQSRLDSRLGRLGRNCFSTENIAYASTKRTVPPLGYSCMCPFCRQLDSRYFCHHCHNLHNRLRYNDTLYAGHVGNPRHYIYQLSRNCRCSFCRGGHPYVKLPMTSCRSAEPLRVECHCRNPNNCSCRNKIMPSSNSTAQIGNRYVDWVNRTGASVNNPLYATIHIGRSCISPFANTSGPTSSSNNVDAGPSTSNPTPSTSGSNEPGTSSSLRSSSDRQHTCDDSCIRNQSGNVAGICQFLGRCERAECNHGRLAVHWWFVNRWLPSWNNHNCERNMDTVPSTVEEPREQHDSDSDDP